MIVHVVFSVGERMTRGRDPTAPLTGGPLSIFAPTTTQITSVIECLGAFTDQQAALRCAQFHNQAHPQDRCQIKVTKVDASPEAPVRDLVANTCTGCGQPSAKGMCPSCQKAMWARSRENDPELLAELAEVDA